MKKFITFSLIAMACACYGSQPFVTARADGMPAQDAIFTDGTAATATIADASMTQSTLSEVPITTNATNTVVSVLDMRITAYTSVPDETDDTPFITADGTHCADGIAASNILPFGTRIEIPALFGDKIFTVHDRMSPKIKNTIDLWMPSVKQAIYFGMSHADVLVLSTPTSTQISLQ